MKLDCGAFADAFTEPGITPNLLTEIAPLCGPRARTYAGPLALGARRWGITTVPRLAGWLAWAALWWPWL